MYGITSIIDEVYREHDEYLFSGARAKKPRSVTFTLPPSSPARPLFLFPSRIESGYDRRLEKSLMQPRRRSVNLTDLPSPSFSPVQRAWKRRGR